MPRQLDGPVPISSATIFPTASALANLMLSFTVAALLPVSHIPYASFRLFLFTFQPVLRNLVTVRLLCLLARIRHQALFRLK